MVIYDELFHLGKNYIFSKATLPQCTSEMVLTQPISRSGCTWLRQVALLTFKSHYNNIAYMTLFKELKKRLKTLIQTFTLASIYPAESSVSKTRSDSFEVLHLSMNSDINV